MISIPLPHVVAFLLLLILIAMVRNGVATKRQTLPFTVLIGIYMVQSVLIGIRWGYDVLAILPLQATTATLIAALSWVAFSSLAREKDTFSYRHLLPHLLPAVGTVVLLVSAPALVDVYIIAVFALYGISLLWLAAKGPDALVASRLDGVFRSHRAIQITGALLIASSLSDIAISLDWQWNGGRYSSAVVAAFYVVALVILGWLAFSAGSSTPDEESDDGAEAREIVTPSGEEPAIAEAVDALMRSSEIYKDMELNLGKLARRLRLPARSVSQAINRVHGMSVSQYVNNFRIAAACHMLEATDEPVTSITFAAGFMTKSNFNREFLRVTGTTPSQWRRDRRTAQPAGLETMAGE